ncbi:hypothetical protein [Gemmata obscuriglobus]|nr:hypothetical protein [Gemmata obscuriglobus]
MKLNWQKDGMGRDHVFALLPPNGEDECGVKVTILKQTGGPHKVTFQWKDFDPEDTKPSPWVRLERLGFKTMTDAKKWAEETTETYLALLPALSVTRLAAA